MVPKNSLLENYSEKKHFYKIFQLSIYRIFKKHFSIFEPNNEKNYPKNLKELITEEIIKNC